MTPNQTTKPQTTEPNQRSKTTHIGETPRKFKTRVLDSRVEHLPYLHNQQLKPDQLTIIHPEQLVIDHSNTCSSIPITLRKGTRPSIPRGLLSGCRWLNNRQFNRKFAEKHHKPNATSHSTTENFDSETNEFVVFLGGIAVANISTNGKKGLVRNLNNTIRSHPFCRCTILALPAQQAILRTVFAAKSFKILIRSLIRVGFTLKPMHSSDDTKNKTIMTTATMWDTYSINLHRCQSQSGQAKQPTPKSLEELAPKMYQRAEEDDGEQWLPSWKLATPLVGGKHLPIHSTTQRRRQTCYVTAFRFGKVTGHNATDPFLSLDKSRSVVLFYEGRAMKRCLGSMFEQKNGVYKNLGTNLNNSSMETLFQHDHVSMVEFNNTVPMAKLRDNVALWSEIFAMFVHKKKVRFSSMCQHFRSIGVEVMDDLIPTFVDKKNEKRRSDGSEHLRTGGASRTQSSGP